jgi:hypothetical protein
MSQMPLPQTPEEVASASMVLLGMRPMQSFSDIGRAEVVVAGGLYELMVSELAEAHPWKFCQGQQTLENDPDPPLDRYETAWHVPMIPDGTPYSIHTVRWDDHPVWYEIMGQRIYINQDADQPPIAEYSYRVEEAFWPPSFKMAAVFRLASMLANAVTRNTAQINAMNGAYELQISRAKFRDSKSATTKRLDQSRFIRNRRVLTRR